MDAQGVPGTIGQDWSGARRVVASFERYPEAQAAVDTLADGGFPVERVAIVGSGLRTLEQVTGRLNVARAAAEGALSGGFVGVLFGVLLGVLVVDDTAALELLLLGLVFGAVLGAVWSSAAHWMLGGRRDFSSVSGIVASRYHLVVDEDVADDAERRLVSWQGAVDSNRPRSAS